MHICIVSMYQCNMSLYFAVGIELNLDFSEYGMSVVWNTPLISAKLRGILVAHQDEVSCTDQ